MRTELPVCLRCCFCFPLRYGLITFGYVKLVVATILLLCLLTTLYQILGFYLIMYKSFHHVDQLVIISVVIVIVVMDIVFHVIFLVGAHKKQVNLLKIYYFYSMVLWVLMVIISIVCIGILMNTFTNYFNMYIVYMLVLDVSMMLIYHIVHVYILLLVRSEMIKLKNAENFRFVNNAAEADCTLRIDESCYEKQTDNENFIEENESEYAFKKRTCTNTNGKCDARICCQVDVNDERLA